MSMLRRLRRQHDRQPSAPVDPKYIRMLFEQLMTAEELAELATEDDEPCDFAKPPGAPSATRCYFRRDHACPCRYFGDFESGPL